MSLSEEERQRRLQKVEEAMRASSLKEKEEEKMQERDDLAETLKNTKQRIQILRVGRKELERRSAGGSTGVFVWVSETVKKKVKDVVIPHSDKVRIISKWVLEKAIGTACEDLSSGAKKTLCELLDWALYLYTWYLMLQWMTVMYKGVTTVSAITKHAADLSKTNWASLGNILTGIPAALSKVFSAAGVKDFLGITYEKFGEVVGLAQTYAISGVNYVCSTSVDVSTEKVQNIAETMSVLNGVDPDTVDGVMGGIRTEFSVFSPGAFKDLISFYVQHKKEGNLGEAIMQEVQGQDVGLEATAQELLMATAQDLTTESTRMKIVKNIALRLASYQNLSTYTLKGLGPLYRLGAETMRMIPMQFPSFPKSVANELGSVFTRSAIDVELATVGAHQKIFHEIDMFLGTVSTVIPTIPYAWYTSETGVEFGEMSLVGFEVLPLREMLGPVNILFGILVLIIIFRVLTWIWRKLTEGMFSQTDGTYKGIGGSTGGQFTGVYGKAMAEFLATKPPETTDPRVMQVYVSQVAAIFSRAMNEQDKLVPRKAFPPSWIGSNLFRSRSGWSPMDERQDDFDRELDLTQFPLPGRPGDDPDGLGVVFTFDGKKHGEEYGEDEGFYMRIGDLISQHIHPVHLRVADCNLGVEGIRTVLRFAIESGTLKTLDLSGNLQEGSAKVNRALALVIQNSKSLEVLAFNRNVLMDYPYQHDFFDDVDPELNDEDEKLLLQNWYKKQLKEAEEYKITDLAKGIRNQDRPDSTSALREIHLNGIDFNIVAFDLFAAALLHNTRIEVFDFSDAPEDILDVDHRGKGRYAYIDLQRFIRTNRVGHTEANLEFHRDVNVGNIEQGMAARKRDIEGESTAFYNTVRDLHRTIFESIDSYKRTPDGPKYVPRDIEVMDVDSDTDVDEQEEEEEEVDDGGKKKWGWTWDEHAKWMDKRTGGFNEAAEEEAFPRIHERREIEGYRSPFKKRRLTGGGSRATSVQYLNATFSDDPHVSIQATNTKFAEVIINKTMDRWEAHIGDSDELSGNDRKRYELVEQFIDIVNSFGSLEAV